jgi:hypothetical protein
MPKELTKEARERIATLVGDVAYGGTKEAIRFLIISAFLVVLSNPRPGSWAETIKVAGAIVLLCAAAYLFTLRVAAHLYEVDEEEPLEALLAYFQPPPPPPPPLGRRHLSRSWFSSRGLLCITWSHMGARTQSRCSVWWARSSSQTCSTSPSPSTGSTRSCASRGS